MTTDTALSLPLVASIVGGAVLLANSRAIIAWTARQARRDKGRDSADAADVAALDVGQKDRQLVSANMWDIVKDLRSEAADMRAELKACRQDSADLRAENATLRARVADLERQIRPATP